MALSFNDHFFDIENIESKSISIQVSLSTLDTLFRQDSVN